MRPIDTIPELLEGVLDAISTWGSRRVWFRGQRLSAWDLVPSAYRNGGVFQEFNVFWARARSLRDFAHLHPEHEWDWYFAARHHGMATRLLDWTSNPLAALYFALAESEADEPARVWMVDPSSMNRAGLDSPALLIPVCSADPFLDAWLPAGVTRAVPSHFEIEGQKYTNARAIALYPSHTNARIIAQNGAFTLHGADPSPLNHQWMSWETPERAVKYCAFDIVPHAIERLRAQLEHLGITSFQLFPDGDHLAKHVNAFYAS